MKTSLLQERIKSIKNEDMKLLLLNNYFSKNHTFYLNSFVHFLERYLLGNTTKSNIKFECYNRIINNN